MTLYLALTTSIVTAASGLNLGSGTGTSITAPGGSPPPVTLYNNDTEEVRSGAYVAVIPFMDGQLIVHARCGDLG